ncbi:m phase phosphoprotein mpp10 [Cystoisospora suis]|uniref:M phase phosphoprotein mpp10 n=1 Tax=Cystoisospora suis TaxID=483139 RepID=A0A2C6L513_9APIC|nr:m phase phosphoprotein mpp10 [Cystoisospora suis]
MALGLKEVTTGTAEVGGSPTGGATNDLHPDQDCASDSPSRRAAVFSEEVSPHKNADRKMRQGVENDPSSMSPSGGVRVSSQSHMAAPQADVESEEQEEEYQDDEDEVSISARVESKGQKRKEGLDRETQTGGKVSASTECDEGEDNSAWLQGMEDDPLQLVLNDDACRLRQKNALQMTLHHLDQLASIRAELQRNKGANVSYLGSPKVKSKVFSSLLLRKDRTHSFRRARRSGEMLNGDGSSSLSSSSDDDDEEGGCRGVSVYQLWNLVDLEGRKLLGRLRPRIKEFHAVEIEGRRQLNASRREKASSQQADGRNEEGQLTIAQSSCDNRSSHSPSKLDSLHGFFRSEAESRKWRKNFLWLLPPVPEDEKEQAEDSDDDGGGDKDDLELSEEEENEVEEAGDSDEEDVEKEDKVGKAREATDDDRSDDRKSDRDDSSFVDAEEGDDGDGEETGEEGMKTENDDPFFSMEDMKRFVLEEEEKELAKTQKSLKAPRGGTEKDDEEGEDEDDSIVNELLEGDEGSDDEEARNVKYSDFFDAPTSAGSGDGERRSHAKRKRRRGSSSSEEEDSEEEEDDGPGLRAEEGELDEEERRLQKELDKLEKQMRKEDRAKRRKKQEEKEIREQDESDQETASYEGSSYGSEEGSNSEMDEDDGDSSRKKSTPSLRRLMAHSASLQSEIDQLEQELVSKKAWNLQGEVWGKQRPRNALLDAGPLDLPMLASAVRDTEAGGLADDLGEEGGEGDRGAKISKLSEFIEQIVKRRIEENLFDDVVRRAVVPPNKEKKSDNATAELDMDKSKVGLGDLYAMEYEEQLRKKEGGDGGGKMSEEDKEKAELLEMFGELMYKLDCLSNMSFRPAPPAASRRQKGGDDGVAAVRVEEAVPIICSSAIGKSPEEIRTAPKGKEKAEMTQAERKAERRTKKDRRRKRVIGQLRRGELTREGFKEREMKIAAKNKQQKENKKSKKLTGLTQHEALAEFRKNQKRVKVQELLSDAMRAARKEQRQKSRGK